MRTGSKFTRSTHEAPVLQFLLAELLADTKHIRGHARRTHETTYSPLTDIAIDILSSNAAYSVAAKLGYNSLAASRQGNGVIGGVEESSSL